MRGLELRTLTPSDFLTFSLSLSSFDMDLIREKKNWHQLRVTSVCRRAEKPSMTFFLPETEKKAGQLLEFST